MKTILLFNQHKCVDAHLDLYLLCFCDRPNNTADPSQQIDAATDNTMLNSEEFLKYSMNTKTFLSSNFAK